MLAVSIESGEVTELTSGRFPRYSQGYLLFTDLWLFDTTLLQEYALAIKYFELAETDLTHIALQSVRSAFLPHEERMKLMQEFQNSIHELTARDM